MTDPVSASSDTRAVSGTIFSDTPTNQVTGRVKPVSSNATQPLEQTAFTSQSAHETSSAASNVAARLRNPSEPTADAGHVALREIAQTIYGVADHVRTTRNQSASRAREVIQVH